MIEQLHDARRTYTFYMDDAVLDAFGPRIGAYGIALYTLLARHAKQKEAFPSYTTMQQKLALSRSSVIRTMKTLVDVGLVQKTTRLNSSGDPTSNLYTLVDLSAYHDHPVMEPGGSVSQTPPSVSQTPPSVSQTPPSVSQTPPLEGISLKGSQGREKDPPSSPSERIPPRAKSTRRCPVDYFPSPLLRRQCETQWPEVNVDEALEAMRDYEFRTGHTDWDATLRTWIRREARDIARRAPPLRYGQQREMANYKGTLDFEEVINGTNGRENVWDATGSAGVDLQRGPVRAKETRLLARPRGPTD